MVSKIHITDGYTVDSCYWIPRDGEPVGPFVWMVDLIGKINQSVVRVEQSGFQAGEAGDRFHRQFSAGWPIWLESLQKHLQE